MTILDTIIDALVASFVTAGIRCERNPVFSVDIAADDKFVVVRDGREVAVSRAVGELGGIHQHLIDVEVFVASPITGTLDAAFSSFIQSVGVVLVSFEHNDLMYAEVDAPERQIERPDVGGPVKAATLPFFIEYYTTTPY